jgi:hypothetical protein
VFTNLADIEIKEDMVISYVTIYTSQRIENYKPIKLESVYRLRQREKTRLSPKFINIFLDEAKKYDLEKKIETSIETLIDNLANLTFIRNEIGSHWNLDGSLISDKQVKEFAEHTIALCEALTCKECGNLPVRDKTGNYWQCQCGKLEMYPHKMP